MSKEAFQKHLDFASAIVAKWPDWKRNALGKMKGDTIVNFEQKLQASLDDGTLPMKGKPK